MDAQRLYNSLLELSGYIGDLQPELLKTNFPQEREMAAIFARPRAQELINAIVEEFGTVTQGLSLSYSRQQNNPRVSSLSADDISSALLTGSHLARREDAEMGGLIGLVVNRAARIEQVQAMGPSENRAYFLGCLRRYAVDFMENGGMGIISEPNEARRATRNSVVMTSPHEGSMPDAPVNIQGRAFNQLGPSAFGPFQRLTVNIENERELFKEGFAELRRFVDERYPSSPDTEDRTVRVFMAAVERRMLGEAPGAPDQVEGVSLDKIRFTSEDKPVIKSLADAMGVNITTVNTYVRKFAENAAKDDRLRPVLDGLGWTSSNPGLPGM